MKQKLLFIIISFLSLSGFAQAPNWFWANNASCAGYDFATASATDAAGNLYVVGSFDGASITFGTVTLNNTVNTGNSFDSYIVKYNPQGVVLWAKSVGDSAADRVYAVSIDISGNAYVAGFYSSNTIHFDAISLDNFNNAYNFFVAKYDTDGNALWARNALSDNAVYANALATDHLGNVYVSGYFSDSLVFFDALQLNTHDGALTSSIFIAKYDSTGTAIWVNSFGGDNEDFSANLVTDAADNIFLAGRFLSSSLIIGNDTLQNKGDFDVCIAKFDSDGNPQWAKSLGGVATDLPHALAIDASDNIYLAGEFTSDSLHLSGNDLLNTNNDLSTSDIFIAKYANDGTLLWARADGGSDSENANSIALDADNTVYLVGSFSSDNFQIGSTLFSNTSALQDILLVKYDSNGSPLWARSNGGSLTDIGRTISVDAIGNAYVSGLFTSSTLALGTTVLTNSGSYDTFIARLDVNTGIAEKLSNTSIGIAPNPAKDKFTISTSNGFLQQVAIYTSIGKLVYQLQVNATSAIIDINNLAKGIYLVQVSNQNKTISNHKLIVD